MSAARPPTSSFVPLECALESPARGARGRLFVARVNNPALFLSPRRSPGERRPGPARPPAARRPYNKCSQSIGFKCARGLTWALAADCVNYGNEWAAQRPHFISHSCHSLPLFSPPALALAYLVRRSSISSARLGSHSLSAFNLTWARFRPLAIPITFVAGSSWPRPA